ncbi:hypothetical protein RF11_07449 [Thelohanellus kitauei]|uniref:Tc1-like transposase DDE domain-containing protein n=1 Tax=Thelohanellus kitauei TaxID=669202 RepID=A0A0C2IPP9_THEKT|nr:hypothetical protein RF11_07449 [Thelohanellus kitauei]
MICRYGRDLTGVRATKVVRGIEVSKLFCCLHDCFLEYLQEIFEVIPAIEISEVYLVMDNVPFHKTALVQNTIRAFNHGLVRQANSRTADELFSSIEAFSSNITSNDCLGFYRHIESYLPDCIQGYPVEN